MEFISDPNVKLFFMFAWFPVLLLGVEILLFLCGMSSNVDIDGDAPVGEITGFDVEPSAEDLSSLTEAEISYLDVAIDDRRDFMRPKPKGLRKVAKFVGFGVAPLTVTLTFLASCVAGFGILTQAAMQGLFGSTANDWIVFALVVIPSLWVGGKLSAWAGRLIPSVETISISSTAYNGRRGKVVYGPARRGEPVPVRWADSYGTLHSTQAEPLRDQDEIPEDAEVLLLRTRERQARIIQVQ